MSAIHHRMADVIRSANERQGGISLGELAEECANTGERVALTWWEQRLGEMREHGYAVAEDRGLLYLVASASERDSGVAAAADPAASAGLGGPAVSLSGERLFGCDVPAAYREGA